MRKVWSRLRRLMRVRTDSSGIALIMVIGLLGALMIMVMGYATFMRTERMAAANFNTIVETRELALAALDTLLYKINNELSWSSGVCPASRWTMASTIDADLVDIGGGDPTNALCKDLIYGHTKNGGPLFYLPYDVQADPSIALIGPIGSPGSPYTSINFGNEVTTHWLELRSGISNELVGLYSYFLVNDSGSLDMNFAGGLAAPSNHMYADELRLQELSNFENGYPDWKSLVESRTDTRLRYFTPQEFKYCCDGWLRGMNDSPNFPSDTGLTSYTKYRNQYDDAAGASTNRVVISGTAAELEKRSDAIIRAFQDAGIDATYASQTYLCLIDYVDSDFTPNNGKGVGSVGSLDTRFCGEPIPMLNEVVLDCKSVDNGSGDWNVTGDLKVELWYPFVDVVNTRTYTLTVQGFYLTPSGPLAPPVQHSKTILAPAGGWSTNNAYWATADITVPAVTVAAADEPDTVFYVRMRLSDGANIVDSAGYGGGQLADMLQVPNGLLNLAAGGNEVSLAVDDPRINWLSSHWKPANNPTIDPPAENLNLQQDPDGDGVPDNVLYVRNGPIENTAELGYIGLGAESKPWQSIRLTGPNPDRVLDSFTVHTNGTVRGLVNINSAFPEILSTALNGNDMERFPGDPAASNVVWNVATNIANAIIAAQPLALRSDLGTVDMPAAAGFNPSSENEQESMLRYCADLMDVRGNTFTAILRVRAIRDRTSQTDNTPDGIWDKSVDVVLSEQELAAQIWRDPVTKESQIVYMKWIVTQDD